MTAMYCTIQNKIHQLDSELLKPCLKKLLLYAHAINTIRYQAAVTPNKVLLCGNSAITLKNKHP